MEGVDADGRQQVVILAAGPRDVLVPAPLVEEARQILEDTTGLGS